MTAATSPQFRGKGAARLLAALGLVVIAVAILTPEPPGSSEGGRSSYSTGPGGVGIAFELAQRTGWHAERRITPLDSVQRDPSVQVVIAPRIALGAHEVHRLLDNVRRGGGLILTLDGDEELGDSLGAATGPPVRLLEGYRDPQCPAQTSLRSRALLTLPPELRAVAWLRKPDGLTPVVRSDRRFGAELPVAAGFPLGRGRIVVTSSSAIFANDAIRTCEWNADVAVARMFEYVRPAGRANPAMVFDEYHHGFGEHTSTFTAIRRYMWRTSSGHFLLQVLAAGLVLLLALAPRPLPPRDPARIARRSPLDHAEALGHAYADVDATRTVAQRLVGGLRRRVGRTVPVNAGVDDAIFLDAVVQRHPHLAARVGVIRRALSERIPARELVAVGDALRAVEVQLLTPSNAPT